MTDFDLWFERSLIVATVGTYFGAAFYAAFALGGYVGAVLLAGLMVPPLVYVLVKSTRRGSDGSITVEDAQAATQARAGGTSSLPVYRD